MSKELKVKENGLPDKSRNGVWGQKYSPEVLDIIKEAGLPLMGITILSGKPYINVTGLDRLIKNICQEKGYEFSITTESIQEGTEENGWLFGRKSTLRFFDKKGFMEALKKVKQISEQGLKTLEETFTFIYTGEGWASPKTCEGIAYKYEWDKASQRKKRTDIVFVENVIMMAERRATNRAKREATGTGLTSIDEMPMNISNEKVYDNKEERDKLIEEIESLKPKLPEKTQKFIQNNIKAASVDTLKRWIKDAYEYIQSPPILPEEEVFNPETAPDTPEPPETKKKGKKGISQKQLFEKLLRTHTLTITEKGDYMENFNSDPSGTIELVKQDIEARHIIEKDLGFTGKKKCPGEILILFDNLDRNIYDKLVKEFSYLSGDDYAPNLDSIAMQNNIRGKIEDFINKLKEEE